MAALSRLAVPFVYALIAVLGYPSQLLLMHLEPGPLTQRELVVFNIALLLVFITYTRTVFVDPGRVPRGWEKEISSEKSGESGKAETEAHGDVHGEPDGLKSRKWCRKCDAAKPPRAHHCKECKRCVPRMDHHCPWTANCVSHTTLPHFLRFLSTTTTTLILLLSHLFPRLSHLWSSRDLPATLGPSLPLFTHLLLTSLATAFTTFLLTLLLLRNLYALALNTTTIESWEIARHDTLLRRARHFGGYLATPDGTRVRIRRQEFPYDVGFFANVAQGMGSWNPLSWVNVLARTPRVGTGVGEGLRWEVNGFSEGAWPPVDPDRVYRRRAREEGPAFTFQSGEGEGAGGDEDVVAAFKARQALDAVRRRKPFVQRLEAVRDGGRRDGYGYGSNDYGSNGHADSSYGDNGYADSSYADNGYGDSSHGNNYDNDGYADTASPASSRAPTPEADVSAGEEAWRNPEGERLQDFGVDEDIEFYDDQGDERGDERGDDRDYGQGDREEEENDDDAEDGDNDDDVPLSVLLARRRHAAAVATAATVAATGSSIGGWSAAGSTY
ncbi:palmitoyltransferase pfa4 [Boeremia exigua]|uniref:palmitoyltransferase pfa4 n=1 Tax=Boeremia exigua TaxID=749465 RepID=UPI001E8CE226|nr:palmitoyltransferase pfa4 [Boeremia exigua]KAH6637903.1 palmitoyltransferase pfa4 [Boeremia exigua]